jgi:hypothetical protein
MYVLTEVILDFLITILYHHKFFCSVLSLSLSKDPFMQIEDMNNNRRVRRANYDAKLCKQVKNIICWFEHRFK